MAGISLGNRSEAAEYQWPAYSPNIAYDFNEDFGPLDPPTKVLPGVSGIEGIYADGWWNFVWGANKNPQVTDAAWIPMIKRFNKDFAYMSDVLGWPRDKHAQNGYYSTVYLLGSGLSTDNADNMAPGGFMGTTQWNGEYWHNVLASYIPVRSFDPHYEDGYQTGAMIHEGIHAIFANMPGGYNSAWGHESFNVWLQSTMESQRAGSFTGMGGLSVGSQIAPFIPIECYSGWLQDGSFGGPGGQGVNKGDGNGNQVCTWRQILGGYQYGEAFPHALAVILGPKAIPWIWNNANQSGFLLQDMALAPGGIGDAQARRVIREYRGRQAFQDFKHWSHAFRQLLHQYWLAQVEEEFAPYDVDVEPWTMTCYVNTTNNDGTLTPEQRTLPGWSGANQIPLTVNPSATEVSVTFNPIGANMSCQLVYRDTDGVIHYSTPVASGVCTLPVSNVLNNVVIAVACNTDYIYEGEQTRTAKFDYRLTMGTGITGTADIYTKWWDYNPATFTIAASAGANGSIIPSGNVVVNNGDVQTFAFAPAPGYKVADVLLNGLTVGALSSYTLNPVTSSSTLEVFFSDATAPAAPAGLSATAVNGSIVLDWADSSEADISKYRVYRSTTSGIGHALIASGVTASGYTDTTALHGTTYYYVVTAVDVESNESGFSAQASATGIDTTAPAAPASLTAGLVDGKTGTTAFLEWTASTAADLAGYAVHRSTTSGGPYAMIAAGVTTNSYLDTGLAQGTTYYYVVTASDRSANASAFSEEATAVSKVLAKWDFNDPSLGAADGATVPSSPLPVLFQASAIDKTGKGNHLTSSSGASSFKWSSNSADNDLSIKSTGTTPSAFTRSSSSGVTAANDVEKFNGTSFTVEALTTVSGTGTWRCVLGREAQNLATDDPSKGSVFLGLDSQNHARFMYVDTVGRSVDLRSSTTYAADDNVFRHFAGTTDGSTVSLYVDGVLVARTTQAGMAGLGIGPTGTGTGYRAGAWCVGRGLYGGGPADFWHGYIDSVAITGAALKRGTFVLKDTGAPDVPPAAPATLAATPGDGTVELDWPDNTESDFASYAVYRSATSGSGYVLIRSGITTSSYTVPVAPNGKTYYYVVRTIDTGGNESSFSTEAAATPVDTTPPAAPEGLTATPGDRSVVLNWEENSELDLKSYTVYRSTTSGSGFVPIASGLTSSAFRDSSVFNRTTYYYVVSAVDTSSLESAYSSEASAKPMPPVPVISVNYDQSGSTTPALGVSDTAGVVPVANWNSVVSLNHAITFNDRFGNNTGLSVALSTGFMQSWNTVGPPDEIIFGDKVGMGTAPQTLTLSNVPYAVYDVYIYLSSWGNEVVEFGVNGGPTVATLVNTFSPQFTGGEDFVLNDTYVKLTGLSGNVVINMRATSDELHLAGFQIVQDQDASPDTDPPAAPGGLTAIGGDGSVVLDWADSLEPDLASYTVFRSTTSGSGYAAIASGVGISAYTDNSAVNGTTYHYVVTATDVAGNESPSSLEASATPRVAAPPAPTNLLASAAGSAVNLSWQGAAGAGSYSVKRSEQQDGPYQTVAGGILGSSHTDSGVEAGKTYHYVVSASNEGGESPDSNEATATLVPSEPGNLVATAGDGQVALAWDSSSGAAGYNVKRAITSGGPYTTVACPTGTNLIDSSVTNGTTYYYVVSATNAGGEGGRSTEASATPQMPPPAAPAGLVAEAGDSEVSLSWQSSAGADSYSVLRSTVAGGPFELVVQNLDGTAFTDTGLTNDTTYYYVVTARNAGGSSGYSEEVSATPIPDAKYSGRAYVAGLDALGSPGTVGDTGELPESGGSREASFVNSSELGVVSAQIGHAFTIGQADRTRSEASTGGVTIDAGGVPISTGFVMARALAVYQPGGTTGVAGGAEVGGLTVFGIPVVVTGEPNQSVSLPNGTLVVNERIVTETSITVNALRINLTGGGELVIASARAGYESEEPPVIAGDDRVSGGGWIARPLGKKANFGLSGGYEDGELMGHLTYHDKYNGMKVQSTVITGYQIGATPETRVIGGNCEINGTAGFTFTLTVVDNGEPGDTDTFKLVLSNGYQAEGVLGGGNIQLHVPGE